MECYSCAHHAKPHPEAPQAILTSRRLQLVMFDLKKLPGSEDEEGRQGYLMLVVDHFSKFKWGKIFFGKDAASIAHFLVTLFQSEGTPERWHCDNGTEFVNGMVELARTAMSLGNAESLLPYTHGGVRYMHGICVPN
jgi:hypothetical protein